MTKKLVGEPWGKAQALSPVNRLSNYGRDIVITTNSYSECWIGAGADGFVLKAPRYSNIEHIADL